MLVSFSEFDEWVIDGKVDVLIQRQLPAGFNGYLHSWYDKEADRFTCHTEPCKRRYT